MPLVNRPNPAGPWARTLSLCNWKHFSLRFRKKCQQTTSCKGKVDLKAAWKQNGIRIPSMPLCAMRQVSSRHLDTGDRLRCVFGTNSSRPRKRSGQGWSGFGGTSYVNMQCQIIHCIFETFCLSRNPSNYLRTYGNWCSVRLLEVAHCWNMLKLVQVLVPVPPFNLQFLTKWKCTHNELHTQEILRAESIDWTLRKAVWDLLLRTLKVAWGLLRTFLDLSLFDFSGQSLSHCLNGNESSCSREALRWPSTFNNSSFGNWMFLQYHLQ